MRNEAFELGEKINSRRICYKLYQPLWVKYDLSALDLSIENWTTIKFLDDTGEHFNDEITEVPNNTGGLYMFSIKCKVITGITDYPVYIGRAQFSEGQNLRKRVREYRNKFARENERPLITKMFKYWAPDLYLSFIPIDENDEIIDYEKKLINSLLLPFNTEIPDQEIKQAITAF
jgi:excinuclease UvrABC nuclease subunit